MNSMQGGGRESERMQRRTEKNMRNRRRRKMQNSFTKKPVGVNNTEFLRVSGGVGSGQKNQFPL
jgi:hypothetical protein